MNEIKSFTIYNEIFRLIDTIQPTSKRDEFLGILFDFYFKDKKPNFKPNSYEDTIWINISKPIISYKAKVVNGSKGGRPKKTENETKKESKTKSESKTTSDVVVIVNVYVYIENNLGITISGSNYEKIGHWLKEFDEEIIKYGVDLCVANGKKSLSYLFGILKNWKANNLKNIDEIKQERKKGALPEWFDKTIVGTKVEEKERKEMEDIVKQYS